MARATVREREVVAENTWLACTLMGTFYGGNDVGPLTVNGMLLCAIAPRMERSKFS